MQTTRIRCN